MKAPFSYLPALPAATGMVAGVLIYRFTSVTFCIVAGAMCIIGFIALYATKRHYVSFYLLSVVAGLCCSIANSDFRDRLMSNVPGKHLVEARVIEDGRNSQNPSVVAEMLEVDSLPSLPCRCFITSSHLPKDAVLHSTITLKCHIDRLVAHTDVPYEYDHTLSMYNDGVTLIAYPVGDEMRVSPPSGFFRVINNLRQSIYTAIVNSPVSGDTAAFMLAVILGERAYLDAGTLDDYRSLGIAHVLALSGLHVGILASLFGFLIWPVRLLPHYRVLRVVLLMAAVWVYTLVCGMGDSVVRAAIMLSVLSASWLLQRSYYPLNALLLAVTVILAGSPSSLFSPGFQLSVAAVLSIILFSPVVPKTLRRRPVLFFLANMVVLPVAAMFGTGLVSAFHFNTFPSAFLPANIVVGLVFPYILTGGIIIAALTAIGIRFILLGHILDYALGFMDEAVGFILKVSPPAVGSLHFSAWAFVPYAVAVFMLALALRCRTVAPAIAGLACFILTFVVIDVSRPTVPDSELYIVRHPSTCIMVRSEKRAALLATCREYDTLVTRQMVESKCRRFLESRGCSRLYNLETPGCKVKGFSLCRNRLYAGDVGIYILNGDTVDLIPGSETEYLFVGQRFTGDLAMAVAALNPDSVILAADIHPSRHKRFLKEICDKSRLIDLRQRPFAIVRTK